MDLPFSLHSSQTYMELFSCQNSKNNKKQEFVAQAKQKQKLRQETKNSIDIPENTNFNLINHQGLQFILGLLGSRP